MKASRELAAARLAVAALPAITLIGAPLHGNAALIALSFLLAGAGVFGGSRLRLSLLSVIVSVAVTAIAAFALAAASAPGAALLFAPLLGAVASLKERPLLRGRGVIAMAGAILLLLALRIVFGRAEAGAAAVCLVVIADALLLRLDAPAPTRSRDALVIGAGLLYALVALSIVGATTPRATWFGALVSHGPRDAAYIAITFDDGPNGDYTLQVRDVLDRYGVKATFFSIGRSVEQQPEVTRALVADGQLVASHSYRHDSTAWLDPRYPELDDAEDAIVKAAGVCPAFYRPPHGTHTPFMSRVAGRRDMKLVNWDVSAGDWATTDARLVAQRVLEKVKPGSIILLHDGLDGELGVDRAVVVAALPLIIEGLQQRGLQPVTIDNLLGRPAYRASC